MKQYFIDLFKYHGWANKKVTDGIKETGINDKAIMKILSHILLSEKTWLQRLTSEKYDNIFWIDLSLEDCKNFAEENEIQINKYLNSLSENDFENKVKYTNSKGMEYANSVKEILTHLSHHSSYHRGQVAREMRNNGEEPLYTDYIAFLRLL